MTLRCRTCKKVIHKDGRDDRPVAIIYRNNTEVIIVCQDCAPKYELISLN